jgi:hypothetical protein
LKNISHKATSIDAAENQVATFKFGHTLPTGPAVLEIEFDGEINDRMNGFYRSQYKNKEGDTKYMAVTQFEACDARQAFPCWDEPSVKATFAISMVVPFELEALSNMPIKEMTAVEPDVKTVYFETTPIMSTYVSFFYVCPALRKSRGRQRTRTALSHELLAGELCRSGKKIMHRALGALFFFFEGLWDKTKRGSEGKRRGVEKEEGDSKKTNIAFSLQERTENKQTQTQTQTTIQRRRTGTAAYM